MTVVIDYKEYYALKILFDNWQLILFFFLLISFVRFMIKKSIKRGIEDKKYE